MENKTSPDEEMAKAIVAQVLSLDDFISINEKLSKIALMAIHFERGECLKLVRESTDETGADMVAKIKARGGPLPLV